VGDVNGDGRDDIVAFHNTEGVYVGLSTGTAFATPTLWTTDFAWNNDDYNHRVLADVNGDLKADVVGFKYGDGVYVGLSTGSGFSAATKWFNGLGGWGPQNRYLRTAADINGDGLADLVAFDPGDGRGTFVWLSDGSSFSKASHWSTDFNWKGDIYYHREVADVNGDGRADVVGFYYLEGITVGTARTG